MTTYFVSGHLDLTEEEFATHYAPRLQAAIEEGASFVVGDARGCDAMVQAFLHTRVEPARVRVFHMFGSPRHNAGFATVGGFAKDGERDRAMTEDSNADIAWVRPGREDSGTARNLKRRRPRRRSVTMDTHGNFTVGDDPGEVIAIALVVATVTPNALAALAPDGEGVHVQAVGTIRRVTSREELPAPFDLLASFDPERQELWCLFRERDSRHGAGWTVMTGDELRDLVERALALRAG